MPAANDIRKGQVIKFNGEPHLVMETQHRTPGNLRAFVQIKMRNLRYGKALDQRFASTDTIEVLPTDRRTLEFSYADRGTYSFMDPESFEQIDLAAGLLEPCGRREMESPPCQSAARRCCGSLRSAHACARPCQGAPPAAASPA